jgi:hypothetical protein
MKRLSNDDLYKVLAKIGEEGGMDYSGLLQYFLDIRLGHGRASVSEALETLLNMDLLKPLVDVDSPSARIVYELTRKAKNALQVNSRIIIV